MKLDYATLISPYPLHLKKVGHIKSPTLREIWNPDITYSRYNMYLSLLSIDIQNYCEKINQHELEWYNALSDEDKLQYNMFDVISKHQDLQEQYRQILEFFFVESVIWDNENHVYLTYVDKDENGTIIPVGMVYKVIWCDICEIILQRCGVNNNDTESIDESKVKSKRALEILKKIKNGKKKATKNKEYDKDTELPNIISKVSVMAKSINYINIWDLTVSQLHEHFRQECTNVYFNISTMSVAAWGNEKKKFNGNEWYKNEK